MERLNRVLGEVLVEHWLEAGSLSDDFNPWYYTDLTTYDTLEKRKDIVENVRRNGIRRKGPMLIELHPNYTLAFIEHKAEETEHEMATKIQTWVRGWLLRNKFWSPYTEIGRARLNKIYCNL